MNDGRNCNWPPGDYADLAIAVARRFRAQAHNQESDMLEATGRAGADVRKLGDRLGAPPPGGGFLLSIMREINEAVTQIEDRQAHIASSIERLVNPRPVTEITGTAGQEGKVARESHSLEDELQAVLRRLSHVYYRASENAERIGTAI